MNVGGNDLHVKMDKLEIYSTYIFEIKPNPFIDLTNKSNLKVIVFCSWKQMLRLTCRYF